MIYLVVLLVALVPQASATAAWLVTDVIQQLNEDLQLKFNIFVACERNENLIINDLPTLWTNTSSRVFQLLGTYGDKSLVIVCTDEDMASLIEKLLWQKHLLWALQYVQILYLHTPSSSSPSSSSSSDASIKYLFEQALENGYLHVLVMDSRTRFLYTYEPYPSIRIHQVHHLKDYYKLTRLRNLHGQEIRFTVESHSPRIFRYINRHGKLVYAGYFYELIHQFIKYYNGTEIRLYENIETVPYVEYKAAFLTGRVDVMPRVSIPANWLYFYRSEVLYNVNVHVMVPFARPLPKALYFLRPFKLEVWILLIVSLIYSTILLACLRYRGRNLAATFLEILQLFLYLPLTYINHYGHGWRLVGTFLILCGVGFMLTNWYQAQLSSMLTSGLYEKQVNNFDDVLNMNLKLLEDSFDTETFRDFTKNGAIDSRFFDIIQTTPLTELIAQRKSLNTSALYTAIKDRIDFELYQQKFLQVPIIKIIDQVLYQLAFYIPLRHGLPYVKLFNNYLRQIYEAGILEKLKADAYDQGISSGEISFRKSKSLELHVFDNEFYCFAYFLLLFGWLISLIVFVTERVALST
ncbi:uncharacterized protein [Drosophila tropicalis]|uniref:uncharacterized protein n=1 Tax=Drosophila tropicalis TaxID=46794 RepID=UPI0035ABF454